MVRPTLIDLNHVELKYYPFMISLNTCIGSFTALSPKIQGPKKQKKTKDLNVKAFNAIKSKNEAKTIAKHISCDCKYKFISTTCNSNQKWNNKTCHYECKNYRRCEENNN